VTKRDETFIEMSVTHKHTTTLSKRKTWTI